jgi:protein-tyrosine phosphatase
MKPNEMKPYRICFVCLGNIVRSPLAENLFRELTVRKGVEAKYLAASAGTAGYHVGESPDRRMRAVAAQRGLAYDGRGRQFKREDFSNFDLILAMDIENKRDLDYLARSEEHRQKIRLFREFDPKGGNDSSVPDPYYGSIADFEAVYEIIERSCQALLDSLDRGEIPASE